MTTRPTIRVRPLRLATALWLAVTCATAWAGPRAVVEQTGVDLGEVVRGDTIEAVFEIRNDGDADLRILRVKPG